MNCTLLLTPWMAPHRVIAWERAVVLVVLGKVDVLEEYEEEIRAPSLELRMPAVVRLKKGGAVKQGVRFSRINVYTRDGFRCQYCGERKTMRHLNYDHVVPRVRGGKTVWENIVTSCYACNDRKGSRTPEEAGMTLRKKPFKPSSLPVTPVLSITRSEMPALWLPYCDQPASEPVAGHRSTA
jgi:5-methylcytosine-specific restriction endonuclease McrA